MRDKEVLLNHLAKRGVKGNALFLMEECAELQQALSKALRNGETNANLHEELADVLLMVLVLLRCNGISKRFVNHNLDLKVEKLLKVYDFEIQVCEGMGERALKKRTAIDKLRTGEDHD